MPRPGTYYVGLNTKLEPTNNVHFRKALALALDKRAILDDVLNMSWRIDAYGVIPPEIYGYQGADVGLGFDPDAALEELQMYMDEVGIEDPGDITIQLELRVLDVLVCLAGRAGELVTRQEIVDTVLATEFISDNTLTHAVTELRNALGDDARNPSFIETIHRKGYRLIAPVVHPVSDDPGISRVARFPIRVRAIADDRTIPVDLVQDSFRVPFRDGRAKKLFIIRTVGTDLVAKGDVEVQSEAIDVLKAGRERDSPTFQGKFLFVQ